MTLESIVKRRKGKAGSNGAWRVVKMNDTCELWHYSTRMLRWKDTGYGVQLLNLSLGHGSVSDQRGMNTAFRALGLNLRYGRAGGASVEEYDPNTGEKIAS